VAPAIVLTTRELRFNDGWDGVTREDRCDNDVAKARHGARRDAHRFGNAQSLAEKQILAFACAHACQFQDDRPEPAHPLRFYPLALAMDFGSSRVITGQPRSGHILC
jgi:hypothetical protein